MVSLMAENPFDNFQPSYGTVQQFYHYPSVNTIVKTCLFSGAQISPLYDPFIGKIIACDKDWPLTLAKLNNLLNDIHIRGIKTNLNFLKNLLNNPLLQQGKTTIDFIQSKTELNHHKHSDQEIRIATALLAAAFHYENMKKNYKEDLAKIKRPGFFKRLLRHFRG